MNLGDDYFMIYYGADTTIKMKLSCLKKTEQRAYKKVMYWTEILNSLQTQITQIEDMIERGQKIRELK